MATYLKSLAPKPGELAAPPSESELQAGATLYDVHCGTCHLPTGLGSADTGPKLAGSLVVQASDPASLINVILYGPQLPEPTPDVGHWQPMEAYADKLTDEEIAPARAVICAAPGTTKGGNGDSATGREAAVSGKHMLTCGELLVQLLEDLGVDTVFGIPGVHTVELYRGLPATRIRHITPGMSKARDSWRMAMRASRESRACASSSPGPGMTNILTAMGQAYGDSIPMLVISSVNRTEQLRHRGAAGCMSCPRSEALVVGRERVQPHADASG